MDVRNSFKSIFNVLKLVPIYAINFYEQKMSAFTHLHLVLPLLGAYYWIFERKILKVFLPYIIFFLFCLLTSLLKFELTSSRYAVQGLLSIGFSHFIIRYFKEKDHLKYAIIIIILASTYYIFEHFYLLKTASKTIFGFEIPFRWFNGIAGFGNHTGLLLSTFAIVTLIKRKYWLYIAFIILVIPTFSRTSIIINILALPILFHRYIKDIVWKIASNIFTAIILLYPIIVTITEKLISTPLKLKINDISTFRYTLHLAYIEMFKDNPILGVGLQTSHKLFAPYASRGSSIITENLYSMPTASFDPHNMFIQILVESGILGYLLLSFFIIYFINKLLKNSPQYAWGLNCILAGFLTLNGLYEFCFYYYLACAVCSLRDNATRLRL